MDTLLITAAVFVGVVALVGAIGFVLKGREGRAEERLVAFTKGKSAGGGEDSLARLRTCRDGRIAVDDTRGDRRSDARCTSDVGEPRRLSRPCRRHRTVEA